jgi:hypothetical protein
VEKLLLRNEKQKRDLENELLLYQVSDIESMNVADLITLKDLENYFLKIIDGLINPATTRETLYSIVDSIVINCKEEVFIDVEIRENIKETIGYVLDLIGKRDPRIQSISRTGYRLYTNRVFKCRILIAPHSKAIVGAENILIV